MVTVDAAPGRCVGCQKPAHFPSNMANIKMNGAVDVEADLLFCINEIVVPLNCTTCPKRRGKKRPHPVSMRKSSLLMETTPVGMMVIAEAEPNQEIYGNCLVEEILDLNGYPEGRSLVPDEMEGTTHSAAIPWKVKKNELGKRSACVAGTGKKNHYETAQVYELAVCSGMEKDADMQARRRRRISARKKTIELPLRVVLYPQ